MKGEDDSADRKYRPIVEPLESRTKSIIGASHEVFRTMGSGLLEKVYERSLLVELELRGHRVETQVRAAARYKGVDVGFYVADMVVDGTIVVELKVGEAIVDAHRRQVLNYVKALGLPVGLILNFSPEKAVAARVVQWDLMTSRKWA